MKQRIIFAFLGIGLSACATPSATIRSDNSDLKKQILELQKIQGQQAAQIEELNNKILLLRDRIDHAAGGETLMPPPPKQAAAPVTAPATPKSASADLPPPPDENEMVVHLDAPPDPSTYGKKGTASAAASIVAEDFDKLYDQALADSKKPQLTSLEADVDQLLKNHKESPTTNNALFLLAETLFERGQYSKGATEFERLYKMFPDGNKAVAALYRLGLCYEKLGHGTEAKEAFQNVISVYPGSREAIDAEKRLKDGGAKKE